MKKYGKKKRESAKFPAQRALVPYVLRALRSLVPHVSRSIHALVPYVPRALLAFVTHVLGRALVHHVSCVLRTLCLMCIVSCVPCAICALVPHMPRALRVLVSQVSCVLLYLAWLVSCIFSGCSCLNICVLLCSSSLTCLRFFKPNMSSCISCLVALKLCASCAFGVLAI